MSGDEFFRSRMGHKFYESDVPRIAQALERIATCLEKPPVEVTHDERPPLELAPLRERLGLTRKKQTKADPRAYAEQVYVVTGCEGELGDVGLWVCATAVVAHARMLELVDEASRVVGKLEREAVENWSPTADKNLWIVGPFRVYQLAVELA